MSRRLLSIWTVAALSLVLVSSPAVAAKKALLKVPVWFGTHLTGLGSTPK